MEFTNLSDYMRQVCFLAKQGYGSISEIKSFDTPDFLDLLEYEYIAYVVTKHEIEVD